jgi:TolB-like protein
MIRYISLLLFIGLSFSQEITIAVLDFDGDGVSQSETRTLTNRLRDEMFKTGAYIVLERGKMDEVLKEQGFQQTGCVTSECAVEVGNMLGVQQMLGGSIGKVGNIYTVSARVIDVQTGEVLKSANYDHIGDIGQLLLKGMKEVAHELLGLKLKKEKNVITTQKPNLTDSEWDKYSNEELKIMATPNKNKQKNNDSVIFDGNTSKGRQALINCLIALISLYLLSVL